MLDVTRQQDNTRMLLYLLMSNALLSTVGCLAPLRAKIGAFAIGTSAVNSLIDVSLQPTHLSHTSKIRTLPGCKIFSHSQKILSFPPQSWVQHVSMVWCHLHACGYSPCVRSGQHSSGLAYTMSSHVPPAGRNQSQAAPFQSDGSNHQAL